MKVGLSGSKVNSFRSSTYTNIDITSTSLWDTRIAYFVIMHEEMNMQPKGIGEDYFSKFQGSTSKICIFIRLGDGWLSY